MSEPNAGQKALAGRMRAGKRSAASGFLKLSPFSANTDRRDSPDAMSLAPFWSLSVEQPESDMALLA